MTSEELLQADGEALRALLAREYALEGSLRPLPGEVDANFELTAGAERWLVKVSAHESAAALALQVAALEHAAAQDPTTPTTRTRRSGAGASVTPLSLRDGDRQVWVSDWLEGRLMAEHGALPPQTHEQLGRALGRLDRALQTFDDTRARRTL